MGATTNSLVRHLTPERGFDLIRIYLGVGLAVRGLLLLMDPSWVGQMLAKSADGALWPRIIGLGHFAGGASWMWKVSSGSARTSPSFARAWDSIRAFADALESCELSRFVSP